MILCLLPILLAGCVAIPRVEDGTPSADDAMGNRVWRSIGGQTGYYVHVERVIGSPFARTEGQKVILGLPVVTPPPIRDDDVAAYELSKISYVIGDGSFWSDLLRPVRYADALLHLPPSEIASLYAVAKVSAAPFEFYRYTNAGRTPVWEGGAGMGLRR